jgi:hypothetical protein
MRKLASVFLATFYAFWGPPMACGYAFNLIVPDVRQPAALSGGSACPVIASQLNASGTVALQWSTALSTSPVTIITQNQTPSGQLGEIQQVITESLATWAGVANTALTPASLAPLASTSTQMACGADGVNTLCFDQPDLGFTPGILAFTRLIIADHIGAQVGSSAPATQLGQILDADIYFDSSNSQITFATPAALPTSPAAYDLQSVLTHELGHFLGFSHSPIWSAMMYPFAPAPGTYTGTRPSAQTPDAPLSDDDRTGLRILYPDPTDTVHVGSISGRILPANPLSLPMSPPGVTGVFGAHVVAVNAATGAVVAGTVGGWSCSGAGPAQFDGTYQINSLPIGQSYLVYAEPLDNTVSPTQIAPAITTLCRNATTDAGWPAQQACVVPSVITSFTTRTLPGP